MEHATQNMFKWSEEQTVEFIRLRGENGHLFTGAKHSVSAAWRKILWELGLEGKVTHLQAKKKWENLQKKYKECKYPSSGEGAAMKATAETWPWFAHMDEVLRQRPSINPPVLIASIPDDTPGPSTARQEQEEEEEKEEDDGGDDNGEDEEEDEEQPTPQQPQPRGRGPAAQKRKRDSDFVQLYREDLRRQWEQDEREAEERRERFERLFGLLEKLVDKN
ncbi:hypothetical protein NQD34_010105 [Periophthalmus magnuspinnatus]|nr:hypothetical protein NQD34_010105 [Periophthalmus magnuspinnatus]